MVGLLFGHGIREGIAADPPKSLTEAKFYGVGACRKCHSPSLEKRDTNLVILTEYETWRTEDKHSAAYAALESPRGRRMAELLGKDGKPFEVTQETACLSCHATNIPNDRRGQGFSLKDGVSCDACHGPAEKWYYDHANETNTWRPKSPEQKEEWGMYNVRDPVKRARMCMSCHVGSPAEGKVVTHAMYAAGHPPLQGFEVANFSYNMPPHWYALSDVPYLKSADETIRKKYYYDTRDSVRTRLVLAGSLVAPRTTMDVLARRARLDAESAEADDAGATAGWPPAWLRTALKGDRNSRFPELICGAQAGRPAALGDRWPELAMANADCFACHHDLKSSSPRPLGGGNLARVGPPSWPFALLDTGLLAYGVQGKQNRLASLDPAYEDYLFGEPAKLAPASRALAKWADEVLHDGSPRPLSDQTAASLLRQLCATDHSLDYDSARQIAWAFRAISRERRSAIREPGRADEIVKRWNESLNLDPDFARNKRRELVAKVMGNERLADLMEDKDKKKDPKVLYDTFFAPLQQIHDEEWAEAAKRRDEYDAAAFTATLRELAGLLK
jgi:hypothetical protein